MGRYWVGLSPSSSSLDSKHSCSDLRLFANITTHIPSDLVSTNGQDIELMERGVAVVRCVEHATKRWLLLETFSSLQVLFAWEQGSLGI